MRIRGKKSVELEIIKKKNQKLYMNIIMGNNSSAFDHLPIFFPTCLLSLKGKNKGKQKKKTGLRRLLLPSTPPDPCRGATSPSGSLLGGHGLRYKKLR